MACETIERFSANGEEYNFVYSLDDGGYYIERLSDYCDSQRFDSIEHAKAALARDQVDWV